MRMNEEFSVQSITDRVLTPALAEVEIAVTGPADEVRGRLMGPSCRFSSTVEVAYPLRPVEALPAAILQATIPEPCFWEPQSPFLYHGPVEFWRDGKLRSKLPISHGLRSLALGPPGLRLNSQPHFLRAVCRERPTEAELLELRQAGCNALVAPADPDLWDAADRLGFLMIGRPSPAMERVALRQHPSALGWLLKQDDAVLPGWRDFGYLGLELDRPLAGPPPSWASFIVCPLEMTPSSPMLGLPRLVRSRSEVSALPGLIGWIRF